MLILIIYQRCKWNICWTTPGWIFLVDHQCRLSSSLEGHLRGLPIFLNRQIRWLILRQGRLGGNGLRGPCGDCSPPQTCTCPDGSQQNVSMSSSSISYDKIGQCLNVVYFRCLLEMMSRNNSSLVCWTGVTWLHTAENSKNMFIIFSPRSQDVINVFSSPVQTTLAEQASVSLVLAMTAPLSPLGWNSYFLSTSTFIIVTLALSLSSSSNTKIVT